MTEDAVTSGFSAGIRAGTMDGIAKEAETRLRLMFTDAELKALFWIFWFSPEMDSIRMRIGTLEGKA